MLGLCCLRLARICRLLQKEKQLFEFPRNGQQDIYIYTHTHGLLVSLTCVRFQEPSVRLFYIQITTDSFMCEPPHGLLEQWVHRLLPEPLLVRRCCVEVVLGRLVTASTQGSRDFADGVDGNGPGLDGPHLARLRQTRRRCTADLRLLNCLETLLLLGSTAAPDCSASRSI